MTTAETLSQAMDHHRAGRLAEAASLYDRVLEAEPDHPDALNLLGAVFHQQGRFEKAKELISRAVAVDPGFAEALNNLGATLNELGEYRAAAEACRRAIALVPGFANAHFNLGNGLLELGAFDDAVAAYRQASRLDGTDAETLYGLGNALMAQEHYEEAAAAYRRATALDPAFGRAQSNLGLVLQRLGRLEEAVEAFRRAVEAMPGYAFSHANLGAALVECGDPRAAVAVCDAYHAAHPYNSAVLACKAHALNEAGDREAARRLLDFDRFIRVERPDCPAGFDRPAAFNRALTGHVLAHPTLAPSPTSHATRFGSHTGDLLVGPKGPLATLETMINGAVRGYIEALSDDPGHPFVAGRPERWTLEAWAVVMDRHGHQLAHIHPYAWLSGVYYVELPGAVGEAGGHRAGWIEFGDPEPHIRCSAPPELKAIRPEEGALVLFPSYFYHRTIPFDTAERRICVAFDVYAARG